MHRITQAVTLAGYYLVHEYYTGGFNLHPDVSERLRALLRPLAPLDQPLLPALGLDERIAELELLFPRAKRAAHLTRMPPVPC